VTGVRVLFLTHAYPRYAVDAAGSFLHRLALALRAGGVDVRVLAPSGEGLAATGTIEGVPVRRFRYAPRRMESLAYTGTMAEQVRESLRGKVALVGLLAGGSIALRGELERMDPDVIHAHWWFPAGLLALLAGSDVPLVTTLHGSDVRLARRVAMVHPLFRRVIRRSAAVTAVSTWLAGEARAMAPGSAISVSPMPADTSTFQESGAERIHGRFLFVGRLNAQKGLADLLDAFAWVPPEATLDVIGEGENAAALRERAVALGLGSRVRWRGSLPRNELPAVYSTACAVIVPSRNEGLGLVAVEAQLCRTPVIAYRSGGLPDVVDPAWGGMLVPPGDTRALAAAMTGVLKHPEATSTQGAAARAKMLDRFSPGTVAASYRELYRRAVSLEP
jgi:glycosyltransferase involved in cell wall biosynthesis